MLMRLQRKGFGLAEADDIFAANRALSRIAFAVAAADGKTRRTSVHESGSLRVRFPGAVRELEAVIVNTAGGVAGGDRLDLDIAVGAGARLVVSTAAAEKVYRALGPDATIDVKLKVGAGGRLAWLPQETILFDRARLARNIEIELAEDSRLVLAEAIVLGRAEMGEAVEQGRLLDRWRVRRGGRLIFAETVRLDDAIADRLAEAAVAAGGIALATMLLVPGDESQVARLREIGETLCEIGASAWNGLAVVRFVAKDGLALRRAMQAALTALGVEIPRNWSN